MVFLFVYRCFGVGKDYIDIVGEEINKGYDEGNFLGFV